MRIVCIGGGPASLYLSILMKAQGSQHQVQVFERNSIDDTFGFGVVFSDATMDNLEAADPPTYAAIQSAFYHWDNIDIHYRGEVLSTTGHGFAGLSRLRLLQILAQRAESLGVDLRFGSDIDSLEPFAGADLLVLGDGVHSLFRERYAADFRPRVDERPNRFVWLGTDRPFPAFTFYFVTNEHGLWRVHAYQYEGGHSTFIVECTAETFRSSGLDADNEEATIAYCEQLFAEQLQGHRLIANKSIWRRFPTISNGCWHRDNMVLIGDAAHTAHFSVGSGTKLAMEDAIALRDALADTAVVGERVDVTPALERYEADRRGPVESLQRAAHASLQWFEDTERYLDLQPIELGFSLLTRSLRITHEDLRQRDPDYIARVDAWYAAGAARQSGVSVPAMSELPRRVAPDRYSEARDYPLATPPPPMFTPFKLRELTLVNRVVMSAMCQYSAHDGTPDDWHFQHLASRAVGGAGLIVTEMTDIGPEARITPRCAGMYTDEQVAAWKRIVDWIHDNSWTRIGLQLAHAGRKGSTKLSWEGIDEPLERGGWPLISASPLPWFEHSPVPQAMSRRDMDGVREQFVAAAVRADAAGFDLIELHMAHGYLLSSFISPLTNQRTDEFGGSLEQRMRYPLEVLDAIRGVWPTAKPISVRISAVDWAAGGMQPEDSVAVARLLRDHDCDLVDVSAGQTVPWAAPLYGRQFQTPFADRIRHEIGIPTMAVGNISSYMDVNTILAAGRADLCALARAHLWDPYWTRNAAHKQGYPLPWPDPYAVLDGFTPRFE